ncbi:CDP-glycerol--UDP-pyrophosphoryl-N-acetylglucosaminyl-N-acetylmannosamine glycerophosphotransferase [Pseudomonas fluorescens]|jgi:cell division inhibitor SulA|uniref:CDP-glycerol--UDP-pyrophosphoryl-N-acetylglucosaminyl-N-acetylmannosamine glycerophosphotransferase n=1 Tax=Pseudomonas fluorescens TaxID=294 RepID=A0A2N1EAV3_PSEFL|nr:MULTISPECIES: SOS-induced cell division inhibitor SulA [Pseudomonas]MBD8095532.1 CDP-glycerol--UDP-pyrophosphoryl-N-acetylglucosaminyl-N-acetylmannosamine glycerophosphotransferase [Pseudomonas fluorescens]MBD8772973.1 CDP-glycerol--UDP-pyrophosphoryl-N-acetylglucosaminyl-N-acetylmannosamine glycerophosphotransferase [Pseudomonas fluorescens]MBD8778659.1 CDP-glycerol--UDP-pyrophosphoryl-N-acetylglucosaminyl-N-acetylmannosamine glycerophosphotransferase [Pseudomonas fluorescens]MBD8795549.1 C
MQLVHTPQHTQLSLFEAFMAQPLAPLLKETVEAPWSCEPEVFSELSLRGAAGSCLSLLAPILRELSEEQDARWLTLIAPPASLTQAWLRDAGLNRERILLLQPRGAQSAQQLTCEALRLGRSHTVVSWLNPLSATAKQQLISAAHTGDAQSLNIRLG